MTSKPSAAIPKKLHSDLGKDVHIHFANDDATEHDLSSAKTFRKKTAIRAVQIGCPFEVETLEGLMQANADDWLAVGINGELYPIAADIFAKTYERVEEAVGEKKRLTDLRTKVEAQYAEWKSDTKNAAKRDGWPPIALAAELVSYDFESRRILKLFDESEAAAQQNDVLEGTEGEMTEAAQESEGQA